MTRDGQVPGHGDGDGSGADDVADFARLGVAALERRDVAHQDHLGGAGLGFRPPSSTNLAEGVGGRLRRSHSTRFDHGFDAAGGADEAVGFGVDAVGDADADLGGEAPA